MTAGPIQSNNDIVLRAKVFLNEHRYEFKPLVRGVVIGGYKVGSTVTNNGGAYLFYEFPELSNAFISGKFLGVGVKITEDLIINQIRVALKTPDVLSRRIANDAISQGIASYEELYHIANRYYKTGNLNYCDALKVERIYWEFLKLGNARKLLNDIYKVKYGTTQEKYLEDVAKSIIKKIQAKVNGGIEAKVALFVAELNKIAQEKQLGLLNYQPYKDYLSGIQSINNAFQNKAKNLYPKISFNEPSATSSIKESMYGLNIKVTSNLPSDVILGFKLINENRELINHTELHDRSVNVAEDFAIKLDQFPESGNYQLYTYARSWKSSCLNDYDIIEVVSPWFKVEKNPKQICIPCLIPESEYLWLEQKRNLVSWESELIEGEKISLYLVDNNKVITSVGTYPNTGFNAFVKLPYSSEETLNNQLVVCKTGLVENQQIMNALWDDPRFVIRPEQRFSGNGSGNGFFPPIPEFFEQEGRLVYFNRVIQFDSPDITIEVYDHAKIDGDIITVFANGRPIIQKYGLVHNANLVSFQLSPGVNNTIVLFAHNLGDDPPNTAAIRISDGIILEEIILQSNLETCEGIILQLRP